MKGWNFSSSNIEKRRKTLNFGVFPLPCVTRNGCEKTRRFGRFGIIERYLKGICRVWRTGGGIVFSRCSSCHLGGWCCRLQESQFCHSRAYFKSRGCLFGALPQAPPRAYGPWNLLVSGHFRGGNIRFLFLKRPKNTRDTVGIVATFQGEML